MKALSVPSRGMRPNGNGSPFTAFHREMDQLLDDVFNGVGFTRSTLSTPTVEAHETSDAYRVAVDLPGVAREDIDINFRDGVLTLKGERKSPAEGTLYSDRWSGHFERVISIGSDVDDSRISAQLQNGVLAITLPKKPERQPRRIEIQ